MELRNNRVVVVLGMHRSGTSAVARGLQVLGVCLGDNLHPADSNNLKGFWEDKDILAINEELLAHIGFSYDQLGLIEWNLPDTTTIKLLRLKAKKIVCRKFEESTVWGFKDPRTARLLSFWRAVFEDAGCDVGYVIVTRNPISVAKSLGRHGLEAERAFYLWLEHLVPSLSRTKGSCRVVIDYDRLLDNPEQQLLRIARALRLDASNDSALAAYRDEFLEMGLRHTLFVGDDLRHYPSIPSQVIAAHDCLEKLSTDRVAVDSTEVEKTIDAIARDLVTLSPKLDLMARQQQAASLKNQALEVIRLEKYIKDKHSVIEKMAADAHCTHTQVEKYSLHIVRLNAQLHQLNAQLHQVRVELQATERLHHELKRTRWFRLREVLLFHPRGLRKFLKIIAISAGGLLPVRFRKLLLPRLAPLMRLASEPAQEKNELTVAYRVKVPPPPPDGAPRVVHVIANFMTGGSSRLIVDLVENLGSSFHQSVITSFNPDPPAYIGIQVDECRHPQDLDPFIDYFRMTQPDFLHVHYWGDCDEAWYEKVMGAAEYMELPVIENINTPVAPFRSVAVKKYVYVSNFVRHVFGEPDSRHVTVYPGSDFELFTRSKEERAPDDCVGMVYRLERDKLNEDAIQPFIKIVQMRPQTRILIVGGGSLLDVFQTAVRISGLDQHFQFTSYVTYDELPDLYRKMSLFIAPVWKESFGQVVPFAMSMKIPVVGYDIGAIGEILGDNELLVPSADVEALVQLSIQLLDAPDRRCQIGEALQTRAEAMFSIETMNSQYLRLYSDISRSTQKEPA